MRYIGSKKRIANNIVQYINSISICENIHNFYEPFCGGCAVSFELLNTNNIIKNIYCNDINDCLIELFKYIQHNDLEYRHYTKDEYDDIKYNWKINGNKYSKWEMGYVALLFSYRAKWFDSYVNEYYNKDKNETINDSYNSYKVLMNDVNNIRKINYTNKNYWELDIKEHSIIYCDAPYINTTQYKGARNNFDFDKYYSWLRKISKTNLVLVSEYSMPEDFIEIDSWKLHNFINTGTAIEKLYIVKDGYLVNKYFNNEDIINF